MTCIVGIADGSRVWLGGDACSADTAQWVRHRAAAPKVFTRDVPTAAGSYEPMLFGYTSSFRMGQILQHALQLPGAPSAESVDLWLCTTFADAVRAEFKERGYAKVESGREEGGQFLVGYRGRLYEVESNFQVGSDATQEAAIGCGYHFALGSLATTRGLNIDPERRIKMALHAAAEYSAYVMEPFTTLMIPAA